nr:MAG TPA: hypothetical protein [Caudoviricetes sp.]
MNTFLNKEGLRTSSLIGTITLLRQKNTQIKSIGRQRSSMFMRRRWKGIK